MSSPIETDAVIIGAGPVGLFQVFELGLLEIQAHVVDSLAHPGGQCVELYADKPIYDIPSVLMCTGRELVDRLLRQIEPFGATFHLGQKVSTLQRREDGRFHLATSRGTEFIAKTVFIAAGVGAFVPRTLKLADIARFEAKQLFHRVDEVADVEGRHVVILGDEDAAIEHALTLSEATQNKPASVTLLHRRDVFRAAPERVERMRERCAGGAMQLVIGQPTGYEESEGRLSALQVVGPDDITRSVPADVLLVLLGLSPKLGPVADWGLALERKQLTVDTEQFATSEPGIFAVGDINTYPGKKKLILCGFHECTLAAFGAAAIVFPGKKVLLQYTTTSPRLHDLLGVQTPGKKTL